MIGYRRGNWFTAIPSGCFVWLVILFSPFILLGFMCWLIWKAMLGIIKLTIWMVGEILVRSTRQKGDQHGIRQDREAGPPTAPF